MGIRLARAGGVEDGRYFADAERCRETVVNSDLARNFDSYSFWATSRKQLFSQVGKSIEVPKVGQTKGLGEKAPTATKARMRGSMSVRGIL